MFDKTRFVTKITTNSFKAETSVVNENVNKAKESVTKNTTKMVVIIVIVAMPLVVVVLAMVSVMVLVLATSCTSLLPANKPASARPMI